MEMPLGEFALGNVRRSSEGQVFYYGRRLLRSFAVVFYLKKKKFEAKIIDIGSQVFLLNFARNLTS